VRLIEARTIEVRGDDPRPAALFIGSIKRHRVLLVMVTTRSIASGTAFSLTLPLVAREI